MKTLFLLLLLGFVGLIMPSKLDCANGGVGPCVNNKECPVSGTCIETPSGYQVCCEDSQIVAVKDAKGN